MTSLELKAIMIAWLQKRNHESMEEYMDKGDRYYLGMARAFSEITIKIQSVGEKGGE